MQAIPIPKNSTTPFKIPYALCFDRCRLGKHPTMWCEIINDDGSTVNAPNITITKNRNSDGFITDLLVNESPSETSLTSDNLLLIIKP